MRLLKHRSELGPSDLPLRVYGAKLCSHCVEVRDRIRAAGLAADWREIDPVTWEKGDLLDDMTLEEQVAVLAAFTYQEGLFPAVLARDLNAMVEQDRIEEFLEEETTCPG